MRIRISGGAFLSAALCLGAAAPATVAQVSSVPSVQSVQKIPRSSVSSNNQFRKDRPPPHRSDNSRSEYRPTPSAPGRPNDRPPSTAPYRPADRPTFSTTPSRPSDRSPRDRPWNGNDSSRHDHHSAAWRHDQSAARAPYQTRFPGPVDHSHVWSGSRHYFRPGPTRYFGSSDRHTWRSGTWSHGYRNGRMGWWWKTAGVWYWYAYPVYPYPDMVSTFYYYDPVPTVYAPPQVILDSSEDRYYCPGDSVRGYPAGFYPDVQTCPVPFVLVPPDQDQ
jgi:hypothetical protein